MAVDRDGKIVALRVHTNANLGAYLSTFAPLIPTFLYGPLLSGAYKIPEIYCEVIGSSPTRRRSTRIGARAVPRRRICSSGCAT